MCNGGIIPETRGDVLIRGLCEIQTESIIDVIFGDDDVENYVKEGMDTIFPRWEITNKEKHGRHCHEEWKHFSPFVLSVDEILGKEAQVVLATLSQLMTEKIEEHIFHIKGWVNGRIAIDFARL